MLFQSTFRSVAAAVADIRGLLKAAAVFRNEVFAEGIAHTAGFAEPVVSGSMAGMTDPVAGAGEPAGTGIVFFAVGADSLFGQTGLHLL